MERKNGLLKRLMIQLSIVVVMALLVHYVWKETATLFDLPELKFPKGLAIAIFLRLWTYIPVLVTNKLVE